MENNFLRQITDSQISEAKMRIWNKMQSKLPERGISPYMNVGRVLRRASGLDASRLLKVQMKERLLHALPDLERSPSYVSYLEKFRNLFGQKRVWSMAVLSAFFLFIFAPIFRFTPMVSAATNNILEISQGEAVIIRHGEKIQVSDEAVVMQGDKIEIANDSMAHLYFIDDSRMTLGPGARIVVTEVYVNPGNKARTEVVVDQFAGRTWTQVLNLVGKNSFFAHRFPNGEVSVTQRASFDVNVAGEDSTIEVARNLVDILVNENAKVYSGTIGQGVKLELGPKTILTSSLNEAEKNDVWWKFNLAFEKSYARTVDEKYKNEAAARVLILPGNPLYKLKTFQEDIRSFVTFSKSGKQELAVERAQSRLNEAQALIAQGLDDEKVGKVLDEYEKAVGEAMELSGAGEELLAHTEEAQKAVLSSQESDTGTEMLKSTVSSAAALSSQDQAGKNESMLLSASQRLQTVPDLIENGSFDSAMQYLANYRDESRAILVELESVQLEEREELILNLLDQKLKDLQMLRVISAMPQLSGFVDVNAHVLSEMSLVVLSLRERELQHLSDFFSVSANNPAVQKMLYLRLKNSVDLNANLAQMLKQVEDQLDMSESGSGLVMDIEISLAPTDPRLIRASEASALD